MPTSSVLCKGHLQTIQTRLPTISVTASSAVADPVTLMIDAAHTFDLLKTGTQGNSFNETADRFVASIPSVRDGNHRENKVTWQFPARSQYSLGEQNGYSPNAVLCCPA